MAKINMKKIGLFAGGVLFGTAGIKLLSSRTAKKAYTHCTAAFLRARKSVMKTASTVKENADDIYAEAKQINEKYDECDAVIDDDVKENAEETEA